MARIVDLFTVYEWQRYSVWFMLVLSLSPSATLSGGVVASVKAHLEVERHLTAICRCQFNRLDYCRQLSRIIQVTNSYF